MIQTSPTMTATPRFDTGRDESALDVSVVTPKLTWWGAIVGGAFVAIGLQAILTVLGMAIGLSVVGASEQTPGEGVSWAAAIWWFITGLVSLFVGGWVAGRMCPSINRFIGGMHGALAWCTVLILSVALVTMAGGAALGGTLGLMGDQLVDQSSANLRGDVAVDGGRDVSLTNRAGDFEPRVEEATKSAAGASWATFIAMVLGVTAAFAGGAIGARSGVGREVAPRSPDNRATAPAAVSDVE